MILFTVFLVIYSIFSLVFMNIISQTISSRMVSIIKLSIWHKHASSPFSVFILKNKFIQIQYF